MFKKTMLCVALSALALGSAQAATYTEDFNAPFPAWESGWFGVNSDAYSYYCARPCADRGNNPDGLWLGGVDGPGTVGAIDVTFAGSFGAGITSLSVDVAGYQPTTLSAYDKNGAEIFSQSVTLTYGASSNPGVYSNYVITSANGISHFTFDGNASGNTSIDNLVVTASVPEPQTCALMFAGLGLVGWAARRRNV
jgi:hypothetical protein